jgi:CBS domain containing-hemolysin-like protein
MNSLLRKSINWSLSIAVITLVLAAIFSVVSTALLSGVSWAIGMAIVFVIVLIGIFFDIIGVAATASSEAPFHAMASKRVKGAKHSILVTRNADRVASFCNDVIGDISGIVSGTASAAVVFELALQLGKVNNPFFQLAVAVIFTSVVASLTVGGKAFGKSLAMRYSTEIIFQVGRFLYLLEHKLKVKLIKNKKRKRSKRNGERK